MDIGKTLYVKDREKWRAWLRSNHAKEPEIWLITYKKHTGKPTLSYNEAVEEALCFGWIDSIVKRLDDERTVQRYSPRRAKSNLSETNKERVRRLIRQKKMTRAGMDKIRDQLEARLEIAPDILAALKNDPQVWKNFRAFPEHYKQIRVGWVESARKRPDAFKTRLDYLIRMTGRNKMYGMVK